MQRDEFERELDSYFASDSISVSEEDERILVNGEPTRIKYSKVTAQHLAKDSYLKQHIDLIKYFYYREDISELDFLPEH